MISIKILTKQEYEKNSTSPSEIVFYKTEKDICKIISLHLAKTVKENITVLQKFIHLLNEEIYKIESAEKTLYIMRI